jgi:hypothetical protein
MNRDYTYHGPRSSATLRLADGTERDLILIPGRAYSLPDDHAYVAALAKQKLLAPVAAPPPAEPAPAPKAKKGDA